VSSRNGGCKITNSTNNKGGRDDRRRRSRSFSRSRSREPRDHHRRDDELEARTRVLAWSSKGAMREKRKDRSESFGSDDRGIRRSMKRKDTKKRRSARSRSRSCSIDSARSRSRSRRGGGRNSRS